jgi:hypothetical protein
LPVFWPEMSGADKLFLTLRRWRIAGAILMACPLAMQYIERYK